MTRPKSIIWFERLYLLAIAIEIVRIAIDAPLLMQALGVDLWVRIGGVGLSLLLLLLASRRGKRSTGLLLGALFVIGLPMVTQAFAPGMSPVNVAAIIAQLLLQTVALAMMLAPSSRAWFATPAAESA